MKGGRRKASRPRGTSGETPQQPEPKAIAVLLLKAPKQKMTMKQYILIILACWWLQPTVAQQLTLQEALNVALKNNFNIALANNTIEQARINNHIGVAGGLPTVTLQANDAESITSVNQKLNNGTVIQRSGAAANNLNANLSIGQVLYNGQRIVATKQRLTELELLSKQQLNIQIQNTLAAVMVQYYDIVRQQDYERTIREAIRVAEKQVELIKVRKSVGLANNADLFQATIDLNALQQNLQSQALVIQNAKADFLNLLNLNPDSTIHISDTIVAERNLQIGNIVDFIQQNPEIASAEQQIKINELLVKEIAAQRYPTVRATMGYNYVRNQSEAGFTLLNQNYGPNLGLSVAVPIYNGSAFKRQQRVAELEVKNAKITREQLLQNLKTQAIKNYQAYENVLQRLATEKSNYELTQQLLQLTLQRYELRVATIIEVREAQRSFIDAGYRLVNLSYAAKAAEIELKRLGAQLQL